MSDNRPLLYEQLSRLGKALAAPVRIEILDLLSQRPRTVERIAAATGQSIANTSQHLQVLRRARLVDAEKQGLHVSYRLAGDEVAHLLVRLRKTGEAQLAELQVARAALLEAADQAEMIDRDTLLTRLRTGEAMLIDVRPHDEFLAGHLPGAVSIPLEELSTRLRELGKEREVVAYCRGPYCMLSADAVHALARRGYRARRLEDGVLEWRAAGRSIEVGESAGPLPKTKRASRR